MLIKQVHQKSVMFFTSKKMSVIDIMFINDVWNLSDIAVFNIKGSDYRCISSLIS